MNGATDSIDGHVETTIGLTERSGCIDRPTESAGCIDGAVETVIGASQSVGCIDGHIETSVGSVG